VKSECHAVAPWIFLEGVGAPFSLRLAPFVTSVAALEGFPKPFEKGSFFVVSVAALNLAVELFLHGESVGLAFFRDVFEPFDLVCYFPYRLADRRRVVLFACVAVWVFVEELDESCC